MFITNVIEKTEKIKCYIIPLLKFENNQEKDLKKALLSRLGSEQCGGVSLFGNT